MKTAAYQKVAPSITLFSQIQVHTKSESQHMSSLYYYITDQTCRASSKLLQMHPRFTIHVRIQGICVLFVVFFFLSDSVLCDHNRFSNCSNLFQCGNLTSIGYPFWGHGRAQYCGAPGYELQCRDGVPEIQITSLIYQIWAIDLKNQTMRVSRKDFTDDPCPSSYTANTTLDHNLFNYTPINTNLTLFYGCPPRPGVAALYQFTCNSSSSSSGVAYSFRELPRIVPSCKSRVSVHVLEEAFERVMSRKLGVSEALREGFEVGYASNASFCGECEGSGGRCGFDLDLKQFTCFCEDDAYERRCTNSATTGTPGHGGGGNNNVGRKIAIAASIAGTLIVVVAVAIFCYLRRKTTQYRNLCCLRRKKRTMDAQKLKELLRDHKLLAPKIYKYSDIKKMTNSFQDKLGQGGYGSVFKGRLSDGRIVAVKVLSETKGNGEEFINEVASISRTSHVNIVPLLGFCIEGRKKALVYEFMPNGSLEKFIFIKSTVSAEAHSQLGWEDLYKIAVGIARGLEYLHRGCHTRIVHFDIKPHNILLDQDFCPKISDFGLAKLCFKKESIMSLMGTRGTIGYIAPELVSRNFGGVSHKSDVYSYGMMVLEMVGGRKNVDVGVDNTSEIYFPHWIYNQLDQQCGDLGLCRAVTEYDQEIARKMTIVGLWCIQIDPPSRPSMNEVLDMLEGSVEDLRIPPKPYLSSPSRPNEVPSTTSTS